MRRFSRDLTLLLLLCAVAVGCSSPSETSSATGPEGALQEFYRHLNAEDYAQAMEFYTAEILDAWQDPAAGLEENAFAKWAEEETKDGKVERVTLVQEEEGESGVKLEFDVFYKDGSSRRHSVTLIEEDGHWKLGTPIG